VPAKKRHFILEDLERDSSSVDWKVRRKKAKKISVKIKFLFAQEKINKACGK
jgi:hypothetical protein